MQGKCQTCNISPLTDWNVCNVMLCPERLFTIVPNISHIVTFVTFYIWEAFYICSQHLSERFVLWHCESHHLPHAFISNFVFCALFQDFYLHFLILFHLFKGFLATSLGTQHLSERQCYDTVKAAICSLTLL